MTKNESYVYEKNGMNDSDGDIKESNREQANIKRKFHILNDFDESFTLYA